MIPSGAMSASISIVNPDTDSDFDLGNPLGARVESEGATPHAQ